MPISAVDAISLAFQHTKQQLLQPFRMGQWARLALVGLLAGELSSGGGCNSNFQLPSRPSDTQHFLDLPMSSASPVVYAAVIALLIVAGLVLWVLVIYISSVMRFILFDSVMAKHCQIRRGWERRQRPGWRYFVWQILFFLATLAGLTILLGIPAAIALALGWWKAPSQHLLPLILGGVVLFFLVMTAVVSVLVVHVLTKDFVVPQMALEDISAVEGWRRLIPRLKAEKGGYAGYVGMKVVLALGAAVILGIVAAIVILVLLVPLGAVGVAAVLTGKAAGLTWNLYTITLAVVVACIVVVGILYLFALISVPAIVFFPAYSIYFFAARYPALSAALYPAPPPAPGPSPLSPPLPPQPEPAG
ncbi:MAG TPA: hypothetical protein VMT28_01280 [Terriglobales bacterium]|nr:hypothetical protein [Terriglobales bacterium]